MVVKQMEDVRMASVSVVSVIEEWIVQFNFVKMIVTVMVNVSTTLVNAMKVFLDLIVL